MAERLHPVKRVPFDGTIYSLELSVSVANKLKNVGIVTIPELAKFFYERLARRDPSRQGEPLNAKDLALYGFGENAFTNLVDALASMGWTIDMLILEHVDRMKI